MEILTHAAVGAFRKKVSSFTNRFFMKILLSPAKSLNEQAEIPSLGFTAPLFAREAKQLVGKLKKLKVKDIMELMHVSASIAELNVGRYKSWYLSDKPTDEVKPAGFLFFGEVYRGLDFPSLTREQQEKGQDTLRFLSGMYGMLRPFDLMYPYRLEMGTKFSPSAKAQNLYEFWSVKLTKQLRNETEKDEIVVNLASNEYAKAIDWKNLKRPVITPVFKEFKEGEYRIIPVFAKHARGAMARYVLKHGITGAEDLKGFDSDGYRYDDKQSSDTEYVFTR
jgi:uncharacterized protein